MSSNTTMGVGELYRTVRQSFSGKVPDDSVLLRGVVRPLSHVATVPFAWAGWSANAATGLGALAMVAGMGCFLIPSLAGWRAGVAFLSLYAVMDMVDGNLARYRHHASYYGKFLDGFVDALVQPLFFICAGWGLAAERGSAWPAVFGSAASVVVLASQLVVTRLGLFQRWLALDHLTGTSKTDSSAGVAQALNQRPRVLSSAVSRALYGASLDGFYGGLWLTLAVDVRWMVFVGLVVLFVVESLWLLGSSVYAARSTINYPRISKNASERSVVEPVGQGVLA